MKKESLYTGVIGLILGGLIGYMIGIQTNWKQMREPIQERNSTQESRLPQPRGGTGSPQGHPTITTQADFENLKKAVESAPNNLVLLTELANKLYDAGRHDEAIPYYRRAMALEPNNPDISTDLGTALFYTGKPDEAIAQFNRSLQLDPHHIQSLHNLVIVNLQGKKDVQAASEALKRLISIDPNNPSISTLQTMIAQGSKSDANPRQSLF
ncbi:MAG: hypothetical protein DMG05_29865 [Acidobacteria bacterium]|nr:MAG: hypothetical protein DMG05_29865 [Acidobacteriota bacterium]